MSLCGVPAALLERSTRAAFALPFAAVGSACLYVLCPPHACRTRPTSPSYFNRLLALCVCFNTNSRLIFGFIAVRLLSCASASCARLVCPPQLLPVPVHLRRRFNTMANLNTTEFFQGKFGPREEDLPETTTVTVKTSQLVKHVPYNPKFPHTNQSKNCWASYVEFQKCVRAFDEENSVCQKWKRIYKTMCPVFWVRSCLLCLLFVVCSFVVRSASTFHGSHFVHPNMIVLWFACSSFRNRHIFVDVQLEPLSTCYYPAFTTSVFPVILLAFRLRYSHTSTLAIITTSIAIHISSSSFTTFLLSPSQSVYFSSFCPSLFSRLVHKFWIRAAWPLPFIRPLSRCSVAYRFFSLPHTSYRPKSGIRRWTRALSLVSRNGDTWRLAINWTCAVDSIAAALVRTVIFIIIHTLYLNFTIVLFRSYPSSLLRLFSALFRCGGAGDLISSPSHPLYFVRTTNHQNVILFYQR